ncbi:hypothetical protein BaRGS_00004092 [Batillaria attramentaria]|uniref:Uncharacterized protein n=1 Tax=Batillaria attramentaria TaxID=370345 RepID=A0ABD0LZB9_9CAEN
MAAAGLHTAPKLTQRTKSARGCVESVFTQGLSLRKHRSRVSRVPPEVADDGPLSPVFDGPTWRIIAVFISLYCHRPRLAESITKHSERVWANRVRKEPRMRRLLKPV